MVLRPSRPISARASVSCASMGSANPRSGDRCGPGVSGRRRAGPNRSGCPPGRRPATRIGEPGERINRCATTKSRKIAPFRLNRRVATSNAPLRRARPQIRNPIAIIHAFCRGLMREIIRRDDPIGLDEYLRRYCRNAALREAFAEDRPHAAAAARYGVPRIALRRLMRGGRILRAPVRSRGARDASPPRRS